MSTEAMCCCNPQDFPKLEGLMEGFRRVLVNNAEVETSPQSS